jgi:Tfp pilus assembly protein PilX
MTSIRAQRGATLIVSLIMLVVLTLFAVSAINLSSINLRIVGNMQAQKTMELVAQDAIERVLSSASYFGPGAAAQNFSINGFPVNVTAPECVRSVPATGYSATSGISPEDNDWELMASVADPLTGAALNLHQGVRIRMLAGNCT